MKGLAKQNWRELLQRLPIETDAFDRLADEWRGNPRLRRGLLAIWAIFLLYLVLVLSDVAAERRAELAQVKARLDRLETIHAQQYWLERAERSQAVLSELEQTFPLVTSSGRAEAQVRSALQQQIDQNTGRRKLKLSMETAESVNDGKLWTVSGTVMGVVDGNSARDFVAGMEPNVTHGRVRRLKLVRGLTPEKVRVEAQVEYFFRADQG